MPELETNAVAISREVAPVLKQARLATSQTVLVQIQVEVPLRA